MCTAYRPNDGQLAVLMATTSSHSDTSEMVAGLINFFVAVMDKDSHTYLVSKLLDREDQFGIDEVRDITEWLTQQWSGRPTQSSRGSTRSRSSGGRKSTRRTPELTSSDSPTSSS